MLLRSFINAATTDPGFRPENTLTFDLIRPDLAARAEDRIAFANRALEHFKTLSGITTVGAGTSVPLGRFSWHAAYISVEERPETRFDSGAHFEGVTGDYFGALGLRLLQGRLFRPLDEAEGAAPVIILNETLARQLFGDEEALGRQVHFMDESREVVGIIGDTRHRRLDAPPPRVAYVPYPVFPWRMAVVIRSSLPTAELTRQMAVAVRTLDPEQAMGYVQTLEKVVHESLGPRRSILMLLSGFSGAAVVLAVIGIYALTAYAVTQRSREFSIRVALGATLGNVVGLVLKRALLLGLAGLTVGLVGSLIATRLIANQLYGVGAQDPVVLGAVGVLLVAVILVAAWAPARTAARADPASALRAE